MYYLFKFINNLTFQTLYIKFIPINLKFLNLYYLNHLLIKF